MRCGASGDELELPIVGPRARVQVSSAANIESVPAGTISSLRSAVDAQAASALTRCYRGHPLQQGQDFDLTVSGEGVVQRVEPQVFCPLDPTVSSCVRRALSEVVFVDPPASGFSIRVGLSIPD